jgi:glutaredoxin
MRSIVPLAAWCVDGLEGRLGPATRLPSARQYAGDVPTVTLLTKPGCHLCDDARPIVERVVAAHPGVTFDERSILDDDDLREEYAEDIPVVLVDGRVHSNWHVDAERLDRAITNAEVSA